MFGDAANLGVNDGIAMKALDLDDLRGKIIRVDPETGLGVPGNPYFNAGDPGAVRSKVFARGFRNPYRFTVDPENGTVYVGDVGWNTWEMLNIFPATFTNPDRDRNAGWPCYEGGDGVALPQPDYQYAPVTQAACQEIYSPGRGRTGVGASAPLYGYRHDAPGGENGSAITAGPKYVGTSNYPAEYVGKVFIGDYARDRFQTVDPTTGDVADFGAPGDWGYPVDIQIAPDGNIAYLAIGASELREIVYTAARTTCRGRGRERHDVERNCAVHRELRRSGSSDIDPGDTFTYEWDFGDGTPLSAKINPKHEFTRAGSYNATLTVSDGHPGGTVRAGGDQRRRRSTDDRVTEPSTTLRYASGTRFTSRWLRTMPTTARSPARACRPTSSRPPRRTHVPRRAVQRSVRKLRHGRPRVRGHVLRVGRDRDRLERPVDHGDEERAARHGAGHGRVRSERGDGGRRRNRAHHAVHVELDRGKRARGGSRRRPRVSAGSRGSSTRGRRQRVHLRRLPRRSRRPQ